MICELITISEGKISLLYDEWCMPCGLALWSVWQFSFWICEMSFLSQWYGMFACVLCWLLVPKTEQWGHLHWTLSASKSSSYFQEKGTDKRSNNSLYSVWKSIFCTACFLAAVCHSKPKKQNVICTSQVQNTDCKYSFSFGAGFSLSWNSFLCCPEKLGNPFLCEWAVSKQYYLQHLHFNLTE